MTRSLSFSTAPPDVDHHPSAACDRTANALATLLASTAAGDMAAFAVLHDATAARVYGLALRIVRNPAQAEEVAQESYLNVWRTSQRFDAHRGSAISWILMITHSAAVTRVRSAQADTHREAAYQRQTQRLGTTRQDVPHDVVHASFEARRVREGLAKLPTMQRECLELAYFGGYTHCEIAALLGLPLGTAKSRIRDGLLRLRDLLDDR